MTSLLSHIFVLPSIKSVKLVNKKCLQSYVTLYTISKALWFLKIDVTCCLQLISPPVSNPLKYSEISASKVFPEKLKNCLMKNI